METKERRDQRINFKSMWPLKNFTLAQIENLRSVETFIVQNVEAVAPMMVSWRHARLVRAEDMFISIFGSMACSIKCKILVMLVVVEVRLLQDHAITVMGYVSCKKIKSSPLTSKKVWVKVTTLYLPSKASNTLTWFKATCFSTFMKDNTAYSSVKTTTYLRVWKLA